MEKKLSEMKYGEKGVVKRIEKEFQGKIAGMGIRVGKEVEILTREPLRGPVVVIVDESRTSLGLGMAKKITVEV